MKALSEGPWLQRNTCTNKARYERLLANLPFRVYLSVGRA